MFALTIDGREPPVVFEAFGEQKVVFQRENLDVGDFQIANPTENIAVIIERKTWSDLISSLGGGRLGEQTARIVDKCRETGARPILLVEHDKVHGWGSAKSSGISNKFLDCTLVKYALEGFSVVRTRDVQHTRDVVLWILERCNNDKVPSFAPNFTFRGEAGSKKFRKKDYGNPWEMMLTAIRGVSKPKAKLIAAKFPNAIALSSALRADGDLQIKGVGKKLCADMKKAIG